MIQINNDTISDEATNLIIREHSLLHELVYSNKNGGRREFQIDLAIEIINFAIENEWKNINENNTKPRWMRKGRPTYLFCDCKRCFFSTKME